MPNKRSRRKKTKYFYCPLCQQRLWRTGTPKYFLFYKDSIEIRQGTGISAKKSRFLAHQNMTYLDTKKWIEGFCCSEHGQLWLLISLYDRDYEYCLAKEKDWLKTNKTLDPRSTNPSVSEFTQRMSRKPCLKKATTY